MAPVTGQTVIVGGSIAGLMHGVVLKALGCKVLILESRDYDRLKAQAAGLSLGPYGQELMKTYVQMVYPYALENPGSQILNADGEVISEIPARQSIVTSTWKTVFERLKAKFEEFESPEAKTRYEIGKKVIGIKDMNDYVAITYQHAKSGATSTIHASMVIAADGCNSAIRKCLLGDVAPEYAGYVAWRGCVPESRTPTVLKATEQAKFLFFMAKDNYILAYLTPGPSGSTAPGERLLDWCWYDICDGQSIDEIMTDSSGYRHGQTVPRGSVRPDVWKKQVSRAEEVLPAGFRDIVKETTSPLVTAITSFESPKALLCGGKVVLVGEAFTQLRPHLGLSSNLAAFQALTLANALKGQKSLAEWEEEVIKLGHEDSVRSSAMGTLGMTGSWPQGYVPPYLRKD